MMVAIYILYISLIEVVWGWRIKPLPPPSDFTVGSSENRLGLDLIFPGTKWCGSGNVAQSFNDLGTLESTDRCCRAHDNCDDVLEAGQTLHGLTNNDFYSKLHCNCDIEFLRCLRGDETDNSDISSLIGYIYFDALNTQCFKRDFPIVRCATFYSGSERCQKYQLDKTAPKVYQFFDVPRF